MTKQKITYSATQPVTGETITFTTTREGLNLAAFADDESAPYSFTVATDAVAFQAAKYKACGKRYSVSVAPVTRVS